METAGKTLMKFGVMPRYRPQMPSVRKILRKTPIMLSSFPAPACFNGIPPMGRLCLDFLTTAKEKEQIKILLVYVFN